MSSSLALLDRAHLNAMTGGDKELALEVIDIFREQTSLWIRITSYNVCYTKLLRHQVRVDLVIRFLQVMLVEPAHGDGRFVV